MTGAAANSARAGMAASPEVTDGGCFEAGTTVCFRRPCQRALFSFLRRVRCQAGCVEGGREGAAVKGG